MYTQKALEQSLRRKLMKAGYTMHKSRRCLSLDNMGGYMIVDLYGNYVVAGNRFDLSLEEVQDWINEMC